MAKTIKPKIVKCRYKHCLHETKELNAEDAVKVGTSMYYHPDCHKTKQDIDEITRVFAERVNKNVNFPVLVKTINNIVFGRGCESGFVLYAMNYCLNHGWNLQYPGGLYRCIENMDAQREYQKMQQRKLQAEQQKQNVFAVEDVQQSTFTYTPPKNRGFNAILGK